MYVCLCVYEYMCVYECVYFQPRKKIIGADPVLIVWCEHPLDYHPDTIVSGVTQVHIIVYPYKKQGMPTGKSDSRVFTFIQF